jgi:hypothetical protein
VDNADPKMEGSTESLCHHLRESAPNYRPELTLQMSFRPAMTQEDLQAARTGYLDYGYGEEN